MRCASNRRYIPPVFIIILISISSNLNAQHIKLAWNPNPEIDIKYYVIYKASTRSQETDIATVPATDTIFLDHDIVTGQTYYYRITAVDSADNVSEFTDPVEVRTDITTMVDNSNIPEKFDLSQNFPNPFNPETKFKYHVAENSKISLVIYNLLGKKIKTLVNEYKTPGVYIITWDGRDEFSNKMVSGIYLVRFRAGNFSQTRKLVLQK